jgi:DNA polymerase-1
MFVGEAPGKDELVTHRPFTGGSGKVLTSLCMSTDIDRRQSYITNTVKCRPTAMDPVTKELKDRAPTKTELAHCAPYLQEELDRVKPNLVVALGASALYVFKDRNEIGKFRGQCFTTAAGQKVLGTYHPAMLMRQQRMFPLVIEDLRRAKKEAENPGLHRVEVGYRTFGPGGGDLPALRAAALKAGYLVEDLETTGLSGREDQILCCGFGTAPQQADTYAWTADVAEFVRQAHLDPDIQIVGQNSESFDFEFLFDKGIPRPTGGPRKRFDTLLAFHLISADLPKDLGTQGSVYTDREYWKDKGRNAKSLEETMEYCCEDIDGTCRSFLTQQKELAYLGMEDLYYGSVMPLQPVLRKMTRRGLRKDAHKAATWSLAMNLTADKKEEVLRKGLGDPFFSVNSSKQVMKLLYEDLQLPIQYTRDKNRGSRPTANAEAIEALALLTDNPVFHHFNEIRTLRKWASTYCDVETDEASFVHPEFGSAKAANGRLNSWNPNGQNIPVELREMFIADSPDHVIVSADYSQVEWRCEMALAGDQLGLELFASGKDIHRMAATGFTGVPYHEVTQDQRHAAKFIVYGLLYGRSAASIAKQTGSSKEAVEAQIKGFFKVFTGVDRHTELIQRLVAKQQYLRNPFARRRWWYTRQMTEVLNFLPSSTAADMMYLVLPKLEAQLPPGATLRLTVHDEIDVVSPRDTKTLLQVRDCIKDIMEAPWPQVRAASLHPERIDHFFPRGWYVPVDITYGDNWKQCKPKSKAEEAEQLAFQQKLGVLL